MARHLTIGNGAGSRETWSAVVFLGVVLGAALLALADGAPDMEGWQDHGRTAPAFEDWHGNVRRSR